MTDKYEVTAPRPPGCGNCPHDFTPHVLVMTESGEVAGVQDVPVGGLMFCPVPGCGCTATWSVKGYPRPAMPGPEALVAMRLDVLGG